MYLDILCLILVIGTFQGSTQTISPVSFPYLVASVSIHPLLTGPDMAYLGSRVAFRCIVPNSSLPVTYELMQDSGVLIATRTDHQADQPASFFLKVTATSGGTYYCEATTEGSTRMSNSIKLTVVSE